MDNSIRVPLHSSTFFSSRRASALRLYALHIFVARSALLVYFYLAKNENLGKNKRQRKLEPKRDIRNIISFPQSHQPSLPPLSTRQPSLFSPQPVFSFNSLPPRPPFPRPRSFPTITPNFPPQAYNHTECSPHKNRSFQKKNRMENGMKMDQFSRLYFFSLSLNSSLDSIFNR